MLFTTLCLLGLVLTGVAKATQIVMRRLDLDVMTALLWLGLAERPGAAPVARAREIVEPGRDVRRPAEPATA
jgi:hypothetical protein